MARIREKLTYANVVATLALIVALGIGTAWAGTHLSKNSVKSKQIKDGAVQNADLASDAVTSGKVKDGSLLGADFAAGSVPQGQRGATGPQGVTGPSGATGGQGTPGRDATELFAYVKNNGALLYGRGVTSVTKNAGNGDYTLTFNRDLTSCVGFANVGFGAPPGGGGITPHDQANVTAIAGSQAEVLTSSPTGTAGDDNFSVAIYC